VSITSVEEYQFLGYLTCGAILSRQGDDLKQTQWKIHVRELIQDRAAGSQFGYLVEG
jgi:hypothetical protein